MFAWENLSVGLVSASQTQTTTLAVTTDAQIGNDLDVGNNVGVGNDLGCTGNASILQDLEVTGDVDVRQSLNVDFAGQFGTDLNAAFVGASGLMETPTMVMIPQAVRPTTPVEGQSIYNQNLRIAEIYDGTQWDLAQLPSVTLFRDSGANQRVRSTNVDIYELPIQLIGSSGLIKVQPDNPSLFGSLVPYGDSNNGVRGSFIEVPAGFIGRVEFAFNVIIRNNFSGAQSNVNLSIGVYNSGGTANVVTTGTGTNIQSITTDGQLDFTVVNEEKYDVFGQNRIVLHYGGTESATNRQIKFTIAVGSTHDNNLFVIGSTGAGGRQCSVTVYSLE
jgi:hypothetical protein